MIDIFDPYIQSWNMNRNNMQENILLYARYVENPKIFCYVMLMLNIFEFSHVKEIEET